MAPGWLHGFLPDQWHTRYGQRARDWRLPKAEAAREALAVIVGTDGFALLGGRRCRRGTELVAGGPGGERPCIGCGCSRTTATSRACAGAASASCRPARSPIGSPYDSQARYGSKRGVGWRGCKAHFTQTYEPDRPHLIVHVATTVAANDVDTVAARHTDLAGVDLLPEEHLVDAGYTSVDHVLAARADHGIERVGPLPPDAGWQARQQGFDLARFASTGIASRSPAPTARPAATGTTAAAARACRSCR